MFLAVEALLAEGEAWKAIVTDEDAKAAYDVAVAGIDPAAIEGDGLAEAKTVDAAIVELVKAQPAEEGANFTRAIINPSFELGNADGWTSNDGGRVANNGNFGAATGSFFVEKWTAAPNTLSNGSFLQTIYGLPEGKYKVTAEMQNREQGNGDAAGTGLFLVANEDFTEAIANNGETFEVIGTTHRGVLQIGVLLDNCSGNWICFDNFKLTLVETLPAEEPEFANGDVNHDDAIDVTDAVLIIDEILMKNPANFDASLADVNNDGSIDVTDVVMVIDAILGKIQLARGVEASQKDLSAYTAFQMDLTIPAGYVLEGVELTEMAKDSHKLAYNMLSDGRCRVVVFSMDNEALPGAWDEVIRLNLRGQGDAFVNVDRAMFVTVGGERHELLLNGTTSIAQLSTLNSQFSIVYDLQGRKVEKTAKGVYVIDGKKVVSLDNDLSYLLGQWQNLLHVLHQSCIGLLLSFAFECQFRIHIDTRQLHILYGVAIHQRLAYLYRRLKRGVAKILCCSRKPHHKSRQQYHHPIHGDKGSENREKSQILFELFRDASYLRRSQRCRESREKPNFI